jgi:segregation and condensation protein B
MAEHNLELAVEALLFASDRPLSISKIKDALDLDQDQVKESLEQIKTYYENNNRSFQIIEIGGGYQLVTKPDFSVWVAKLYKKAQDKIRGASMETLAIIVYKQPITKAEIEAIRGVNTDGVIKTLLEKNLIKIKGRKDAPGRPLLFGTTEEFLIRFGLKDLNSLPPLKEFTEQDLEYSGELEGLDKDEDAAPADDGQGAVADNTEAETAVTEEGDTSGSEEPQEQN